MTRQWTELRQRSWEADETPYEQRRMAYHEVGHLIIDRNVVLSAPSSERHATVRPEGRGRWSGSAGPIPRRCVDAASSVENDLAEARTNLAGVAAEYLFAGSTVDLSSCHEMPAVLTCVRSAAHKLGMGAEELLSDTVREVVATLLINRRIVHRMAFWLTFAWKIDGQKLAQNLRHVKSPFEFLADELREMPEDKRQVFIVNELGELLRLLHEAGAPGKMRRPEHDKRERADHDSAARPEL